MIVKCTYTRVTVISLKYECIIESLAFVNI